MQWIRFYKSIYEMGPVDKPDDVTIEDDQLVDAWYQSFLRETAKKLGKSHGDPRYNLTGGNGAGTTVEVFQGQ